MVINVFLNEMLNRFENSTIDFEELALVNIFKNNSGVSKILSQDIGVFCVPVCQLVTKMAESQLFIILLNVRVLVRIFLHKMRELMRACCLGEKNALFK